MKKPSKMIHQWKKYDALQVTACSNCALIQTKANKNMSCHPPAEQPGLIKPVKVRPIKLK